MRGGGLRDNKPNQLGLFERANLKHWTSGKQNLLWKCSNFNILAFVFISDDGKSP
jgi:hypothetical protein